MKEVLRDKVFNRIRFLLKLNLPQQVIIKMAKK
uniref:Uncharacterized protein n=1 Tax=Siphoviridae sp. ctLqe90 TaxID=2825456 RepID=A0A8S5Q1T1_9CAUD|nr:MAG TPA: hypothetical protein [Siphoviridae sp. ctLqe90]